MNYMYKLTVKLLPFILAIGMMFGSFTATAEDRTALDNDIHAAIKHLLDTTPLAKELAKTARGALVFPNIVKAGFLVGVQYGEGALVRAKQGGGYYIANYYSITAGSYGFQAGVQSFGYVMALMSDAAVEHVETSKGWELGMGPSIVIVDSGMAKKMTTETLKDDVYAFTFGQKGLMGGSGLEGSKITRLNR
jgi:lipid-binding SYLF domain-containing protein